MKQRKNTTFIVDCTFSYRRYISKNVMIPKTKSQMMINDTSRTDQWIKTLERVLVKRRNFITIYHEDLLLIVDQ